MIRPRTRTAALVGSGLLLLAPLAGCGGNDAEPTAAPTSASPEAADSRLAAKADLGSVEGESVDIEAFIAAITEAISQARTTHMTFDTGNAVRGVADIRYTDDGVDMAMEMTLSGLTSRMVFVDGALYLRQGDGQKYLKVDPEDPSMRALFDQIENLGPQTMVDRMRTSLKKVVRVGTESIEGVTLTRYRVTVDTTSIGGSLGAAAPTGAALPARIAYNFFVDPQNLVRRIDLRMAGQHLVITMSKWSEPVDIEAPPSDQVS